MTEDDDEDPRCTWRGRPIRHGDGRLRFFSLAYHAACWDARGPGGLPDGQCREFVRAVQTAQSALRAAGQEGEAARLDGVTWHSLRHTFASRLVVAGVDLRTVQELGGGERSV